MASTTTGLASSSSRARSGGHKRPGQDLERTVVLAQPAAAPSFPNINNNTANNASNNHSASSSHRMAVDSSSSQARVPQQPEPVPLKYVVQEAVKRWFDDTHQEAQRGDVKQQALLGQMYLEGYGCTKDVKLAKEWADKASSRGYKMAGVYCSMP